MQQQGLYQYLVEPALNNRYQEWPGGLPKGGRLSPFSDVISQLEPAMKSLPVLFYRCLMNRFYAFFPFPPRQMQERYDLQNPQNNRVDPRYGGPPYGYGSYPPAPPPSNQPYGLPDINDRYARYPGYQQGRPPSPPSPYPNSYPNQQHWRQPPPPSHHSFMDDLGSFASYFNPFGSAHAEEVPPAPTTSPPKPTVPVDTSLGDRHRLSDMAVRLNEGDKGGLGWSGPGYGVSFGRYQGDPSAANGHAIKAFKDFMKLATSWGIVNREDKDFAYRFYDQTLTSPNVFAEMGRILNPILNIKEVKEILKQMDEGIERDNWVQVDDVNKGSWKNRGRALDPIEQAAIAIWGNKNKHLKDTAAKFASDLRNASTEDVLNYLINQKEYQPHPGKSAKDAENRARRRVRHMVSTGQAVNQAIQEGVIRASDISDEAQQALNKVLKKVGSKERFYFKKPERADIR